MAGLAQMMSSPEMQNSMRQMFGGSGTRPTTNPFACPEIWNGRWLVAKAKPRFCVCVCC